MTLYEILDKPIYYLINYFLLPAVTTVILLYLIYITNIKKRLLNKTEGIIGVVCILLAYVISMMRISKNLDWLMYSIAPAVAIVIFLYSIYINDIKKRPLNKTEWIIGAVCFLLACALTIMMMIFL